MGGAGQMKRYPFSGSFTATEISSFLTAFFAGSLTPSLKSEEVTPEDTAGDVVVLKGKSFADLVLNNDKDVLVEFYAPWCGHCKKLAPTWDELGKRFSDVENVVIAKMDATANEVDVPGLEVRGYPTIFFFKGDDKAHPVKYESGREVEDFIKYVKENGAHGHTFDHEEL